MAIDFNDEQTWPADVLSYLEQNHDLFLAWESRTGSVTAGQYDNALHGLRAVLNSHELHGCHCTRLTMSEIRHIASSGMQLPNAALLRSRIQAIQDDGLIDASIAQRLMADNQADEANRANKMSFCFFAPRLAGQSGSGSLLGLWGGEALYNTHERDPDIGPILAKLGNPCLVEADIAIASLRGLGFLDIKAAKQFLKWRASSAQSRWNMRITPRATFRPQRFVGSSNFRRLTFSP